MERKQRNNAIYLFIKLLSSAYNEQGSIWGPGGTAVNN